MAAMGLNLKPCIRLMKNYLRAAMENIVFVHAFAKLSIEAESAEMMKTERYLSCLPLLRHAKSRTEVLKV